MQDEDPKVDEQSSATEPVAEEVAQVEEPQTEQESEPPVEEVAHEPVPEPTPPEPIPEPTPVPETPPPTPELENPVENPVSPQPPTPDPIVAEPVKPAEQTPAQPKPITIPHPEPEKEQGSIPQKVLDLTPAELDAARRLWATRTIHDAQIASVQARKERVEQNMQRVEHFVRKYGPTTVRTVGLELGMSSRSASSYLIELSKQGKIQATGNTTTRRYS